MPDGQVDPRWPLSLAAAVEAWRAEAAHIRREWAWKNRPKKPPQRGISME